MIFLYLKLSIKTKTMAYVIKQCLNLPSDISNYILKISLDNFINNKIIQRTCNFDDIISFHLQAYTKYDYISFSSWSDKVEYVYNNIIILYTKYLIPYNYSIDGYLKERLSLWTSFFETEKLRLWITEFETVVQRITRENIYRKIDKINTYLKKTSTIY